MFNRNIIAREFNIEIAINNEMAKAIDLWVNMYINKPPWIDNNTKSMGLPGAIANELARLVTVEFESEIKNNDFLNKEYQKVIDSLRVNCEYACAKGGLVFKPYIKDRNIEIDIIQQDNFFPVSYNAHGDITSAIFLEIKIVGDKKYTRVEYHTFENKIYAIYNKAYVKNCIDDLDNSLGKQISLSSVDEWTDIEEVVRIKNVSKPFFSYFKIPQANMIDDNSPLGVSVYAKAINLIREADKQYSRVLWEYEGSELAVHASEALLEDSKDENGNTIKRLAKGKERLYRTVDIDDCLGDSGLKGGLDVFSPQIRDESLFNGLNQILRRIEFNCGLAYGTLSNVDDVEKTATEIKTSKQRSYSTVKDIQKSLEQALKNLIIAMHDMAIISKIPVSDIDVDNDVSFNWDDSIILDKDAELISMFNDVSANILRPEIYLAKKYGVSEEEALKMMPEVKETNKPPFEDLE
ncbi:phage capsid protein [Clostridium baratii]|uniref:phage capsid protein n=1 Tax=Clostridium baratii TaxID=1561 RepID=UPI0030CEEB40